VVYRRRFAVMRDALVRDVFSLGAQPGRACPFRSDALMNKAVLGFEWRGIQAKKFETCPDWGATTFPKTVLFVVVACVNRIHPRWIRGRARDTLGLSNLDFDGACLDLITSVI
jgi:hypothetical protein